MARDDESRAGGLPAAGAIRVDPVALVRMAALPWDAVEGLRSPDATRRVDSGLVGGGLVDGAAQDPAEVAFDHARREERARLVAVVAGSGFLERLAVSNPALVDQARSFLRRFGTGDAEPTKARHLRFEATLVNLVLRGAGRPTPSGLWCGVAVASVGAGDLGGGVDEAGGIELHDDPSVERVAVQVDLGALVDAAAAAGAATPVEHVDTWAWFGAVIGALPAPAAERWAVAAAELRTSCEHLGRTTDRPDADEWLAAEREARAVLDGLRAACGMAPTDVEPVLRVDWRMPLSGRLGAAAPAALASAVEAWIGAQAALGWGPRWAVATADRLTGWLPVAAAVPAVGVDPGEVVRPDGLPTPASLFARSGAAAHHVAAAHEATEALERRIETAAGGWDAAEVTVDAPAPAPGGPRMAPWGSALILGFGAGTVQVRSVRGEPAMFQSRWAVVAPEAVPPRATAEARSLRFAAYRNPSAALGSRVGAALDAEDAAAGLERADEARVLTAGAIPVLDTAAAPDLGSAGARAAYQAATTWGWELVASGLPLLPAEIDRTGHLPALRAAGGTIVHPERWLVPFEVLRECAGASTAFLRFVAWRGVVRERGLPAVLGVRLAPSPSTPQHLVLADGLLSVEALLRRVPARSGVAVFERGPDAGSLLRGPGGRRHVAEVAVTFVDTAFASDGAGAKRAGPEPRP